jgi:hypothetical protein
MCLTPSQSSLSQNLRPILNYVSKHAETLGRLCPSYSRRQTEVTVNILKFS